MSALEGVDCNLEHQQFDDQQGDLLRFSIEVPYETLDRSEMIEFKRTNTRKLTCPFRKFVMDNKLCLFQSLFTV